MSPALGITGKTRLYAIVGDPVAQVRSPQVYCAAFAAAGIDAVLLPAHIDAATFQDVFPALLHVKNLDGVLVTSPFKAAAMSVVTHLHPRARRIGAVNALRRNDDGTWSGDIFDGEGFVRGMLARGHAAQGRRALILGCGGAGSAIAGALLDAGVSSLGLYDPDRDRAARLAHALSEAPGTCAIHVGSSELAGYNLIVNASVVGMNDKDGMPVEVGALSPEVVVGDVILRPPEQPTEFIAHARQCGCAVVTGVDMHTGQIDAILDFFGATPKLHSLSGS